MRWSVDVETEYKAWPRRLDRPSQILHSILGFLVGFIIVAPVILSTIPSSGILPADFFHNMGLIPLLLIMSAIGFLSAAIWLRIMLAFRQSQWWRFGNKNAVSADDRRHFAAGFTMRGWESIVIGMALCAGCVFAVLHASASLTEISLVFFWGLLCVIIGLFLRKIGAQLASPHAHDIGRLLVLEKVFLALFGIVVIAASLYLPAQNIGGAIFLLAYAYNLYSNSSLADKFALRAA